MIDKKAETSLVPKVFPLCCLVVIFERTVLWYIIMSFPFLLLDSCLICGKQCQLSLTGNRKTNKNDLYLDSIPIKHIEPGIVIWDRQGI